MATSIAPHTCSQRGFKMKARGSRVERDVLMPMGLLIGAWRMRDESTSIRYRHIHTYVPVP